MSSDATARREVAKSPVFVSQPLVTDAEMATLKRFVKRRQLTFDELARRYALQFNLGDFRASIPTETLVTLEPLKAAETRKLSMLLAARAILWAGEGLDPEAISAMFRRDGLKRSVPATGGKPLLDAKTVMHVVVNWRDSRGSARSITRRLALACSGDEVDPGPYVNADDPQVTREIEKLLQARWAGKVVAFQTAPDQSDVNLNAARPDRDVQEAAPSTDPQPDGGPAETDDTAAPASPTAPTNAVERTTPGLATTTVRSKRLKRGEPSLKIRAALESLAAAGSWNVAEEEIIARAKVSRSTYYHVLKHDDATKQTMEDYHDRRLGKGPVRASDL